MRATLLLAVVSLAACGGPGSDVGDDDDVLGDVEVASGWTKYTGNPVLGPGPAGSWDEDDVRAPSVIRWSPTSYSMWFEGDDGGYRRIGYATSSDGIAWTKHPAPVLTPTWGSWDGGGIGQPSVIFSGGLYRMWYEGYDTITWTGNGFTWNWRIGYATSSNGITWTKHPAPVLSSGPSGSWEFMAVMSPCVIEDGGVFKMWYVGANGSLLTSIGYATSTDGVNWSKYASNPVLTGGNGALNEIGSPTVVRDGGTLRLWYAGQGPSGSYLIGAAQSADGVAWTVAAAPALGLGPTGSWDDDDVMFPCVVKAGSSWMMWYTGRALDEDVSRIGLATHP